ncbi:hypothetical protein Hanom_Chr09g00793921 [Helianthus anomalus]
MKGTFCCSILDEGDPPRLDSDEGDLRGSDSDVVGRSHRRRSSSISNHPPLSLPLTFHFPDLYRVCVSGWKKEVEDDLGGEG